MRGENERKREKAGDRHEAGWWTKRGRSQEEDQENALSKCQGYIERSWEMRS